MKSHNTFGFTAPVIWVAIGISILAIGRGCEPASAGTQAGSGPVRLARFSYVSRNVIWRPDGHARWSRAVRNLPLRQGAQITAVPGSRAEIQFDDGSRLWMATGAVVSLRSLYSDADGEFTEIVLRRGTMGLAPVNARSVYEVDTPFCSVDAAGPSRFRVDATYGVQIRERTGHITIRGSRGKQVLDPGDYVSLRSVNDPYYVQGVPPPDAFDDWCSDLVVGEDHYRRSPHRRYLPSNVAIVADNLDEYGTWRTDPKYGEVWYPHERHVGWRPYHDGHWVWVSPFGWTWVADEPWGWAPCHYGAWIHDPYGWGWVPGPARQCWSPANVQFCETDENVAWCPLAPSEIQYAPAFSIGYQGGDWALSFSIGAAAVYYPTSHGYCAPRRWSSDYVNAAAYVNSPSNIRTYYDGELENHNVYYGNPGYVPVNARYAAGASEARGGAFGAWGSYRSVPAGADPVFAHGRRIGAPAGRFAALAGPRIAKLSPIALAPTRSLTSGDPASNAALGRRVFEPHGAPGNRFAVQQARTLGAVAVVAARTRSASRVAPRPPAFGRPAPGRQPVAVPRGPAFTRPSGRTLGTAITPNNRGPQAGVSSAAQRAAQARASLGRRPGPNRVSPATGIGGQRRAALPSAVPSPRVTRAPQQRGAQPGQESAAQRAAGQARNVIGLRPRTGVAGRQANTIPNRVGAQRAPHQQAQPQVQMPSPRPQINRPAVQRTSLPPRQRIAPPQFYRPPLQRTSAPPRQRIAPPQVYRPPLQRTSPPPRQRIAPPPRFYRPPAQRTSPPPRQRIAPPPQYARPPVPRSAPPPQRSAPPQRRAPSPPQDRQRDQRR